MTSDDMVGLQRHLRTSLLDSGRAAVMPGAADLTAHLLLYLDDSARCWEMTLGWLRGALDADRVDGGFGSPARAVYQPLAEVVRGDLQLPSSVGAVIDAREVSVRSVWDASHAVVFESVAADARFTPVLRAQMLALETRAKLAVSLRDGAGPIGMICCDWTRERRRWNPALCEQVSALASDVLGPILAAARRAACDADEMVADAAPGAGYCMLTAGELQVARLVVTGMSYKEIARQLNRSFSTVDHRLRSIRDKLGARSTARMVAMLSALLAKHYWQ